MWKCSKCGTEMEGNFCGSCGSSPVENDAMQPTGEEVVPESSMDWSAPAEQTISGGRVDQQSAPEERVDQQPMTEGDILQQEMPENACHQPTPEQSGRKGCVIAAIVIAAIIALLAAVVYFAVSLIFSNVGEGAEDRRSETEVNVEILGDVEEVERREIEITEWASPFNFDVWDSPEIVQIELNGVVLDVPVPPNTVIEEETGDSTALFVGEEEWEDWFVVQITLRNMMESDFEDYFADESTSNLEWHNEWGEILDKQEIKEQGVGLMITHWEVPWDDGFTFTKISQYREAVLMTEIRFESVVGRYELFEAYGFVDSFGEVIESILEDILWEETQTVREHIGFDSPEALTDRYLDWTERGVMSTNAELAEADQVVSRVAIFELGGEKLMFIVDVAKVDGKWKIFDFGGTLDVLLSRAGWSQGIIPLELAQPGLLDEFDLEAVMIPMDELYDQ